MVPWFRQAAICIPTSAANIGGACVVIAAYGVEWVVAIGNLGYCQSSQVTLILGNDMMTFDVST
jgi:hypothetical protein